MGGAVPFAARGSCQGKTAPVRVTGPDRRGALEGEGRGAMEGRARPIRALVEGLRPVSCLADDRGVGAYRG